MKKTQLSILMAVILVIPACQVHKTSSIELEIDTPSKWQADQSINQNETRAQAWWLVFEDEQLNKMMEDAFQDNLGLKQAYARLHQVEAVFDQAKAGRLPQISLKGNQARGQSLSIQGMSIASSYNLSASASFEVDLWGKLKSRQEARNLDWQASTQDIQTLMLSLSAQLADTFYLVTERQEQLELARQTLDSRVETLDLVKSRYREGLVTSLDVYQARQVLALSESKIPQLQRDVALASHALSIILGKYPDSEIKKGVPELPRLETWFAAGLPSDILKNRPDIRAEILRLKSSDLEVGMAIADRFPSINLFGEYGRSGFANDFSLSGTVWNLMASLTMPLIDWGGRKAEVQRKKAVFEEKYAHYNETVLNAFREVEDALVGLEKTEEIIGFQEKETHAAKASLELAKDQYMDGLSNYLPVLTAQTLYFDSQARLIASRRQLISNQISLVRALGWNWMPAKANNELNAQEESEK